MARLSLDNVTKNFGAFTAVDRVSLAVKDGEFLAVLGPSGCGKTTLLRLVAGFEPVSGGAIHLGDKLMSDEHTHVPTERRRIGIVFQSYALWPHMSVFNNVGYPLRVAKMKGSAYTDRVKTSLAMVGLDGFGDRPPAELSGGQRQRVALARCFVMEPQIVLLDEPLANLDVHLRASMEEEFADFHRRTQTTMIYITHDQAEAMALADRIAVMDEGEVVQLAPPSDLYREPATPMIANFIGQGTVVEGRVVSVGDDGDCVCDVFGGEVSLRCPPGMAPGGEVRICLRPEQLELVGDSVPGVPATVRRVTYQGGRFLVEVAPKAQPNATVLLVLPEPMQLRAEETVRLSISGGWVIPQTQ